MSPRKATKAVADLSVDGFCEDDLRVGTTFEAIVDVLPKQESGTGAAPTATHVVDVGAGDPHADIDHAPPRRSRHAHYAAGISVLLTLRQRFPNAFARLNARRRKPLKIGIFNDVIAGVPEIVAADLAVAFQIYTRSASYLAVCKEGTERVGLDGQAVGAVTAEQAAHAKRQLDKIKTRNSKPSQSATPAPKRISLSDLREAAKRRREATP